MVVGFQNSFNSWCVHWVLGYDNSVLLNEWHVQNYFMSYIYTSISLCCVTITLLYISSLHYSDVIMGTIVSQIISLMTVYLTVFSDADQRKHQSSASLAFVLGIHRWPVNFPRKWPVTRKKVSIWWRHHDASVFHNVYHRRVCVTALTHRGLNEIGGNSICLFLVVQ